MNFKKVIILFIAFTLLSYYYFHYELKKRTSDLESTSSQEKILALNEDDTIHSLSIEREGMDIELVKSDNEWHVTQPVSDTADEFIVNGMISTLTIDKRVRDLFDTEFDYTAIGLAPPQTRIGIGYGDRRRFLLLGDETYVGSNYYARWEDDEKVFLVTRNFFNVFQKDVYSLREKDVFTFDVNDVNGIVVSFDEVSFQLEKIVNEGNTEWWITEPFQNRATYSVVESYVRDIQGIMISAYHDDMPIDHVNTGLVEEPNMITMRTKDAEEILYFGNMGEDTKTYYAYLKSKEIVFSVAADKINSLKKNSEYFIDKRIAPFDMVTISEFTYQKVDRIVSFENVHGVWKTHNRNNKTDDGEISRIVSEIVSLCSQIEYESILTQDSNVLQELTTDDMICSLSFFDKSNEEIQLHIYSKYDDYYIKEETDPNYFIVPHDTYNTLNDLLKRIF